MEYWPDDILEVELESDAYVCDIDTREEYEQELRRWRDERHAGDEITWAFHISFPN